MYVSDTGRARILKYTTNGKFLESWGKEYDYENPPLFELPSGSKDGEFDGPAGIAVDNNGNVYIADMNNHRIQKFSSGGQFIAKFGKLGSNEGEFINPTGVAVDEDGTVYVLDSGNHRIQKFRTVEPAEQNR